jgi:hypothetical protein
MKMTIRKLVVVVAVSCSALFGIKAKDWKANPASLYLTNLDAYTIKWNPGTNFLTITNLVYVQMEGSVIVRVTDAQWKTITNHYAAKLTTNTISFYK